MGGGYTETEVVIQRGDVAQFPARELYNHPNLEFPKAPELRGVVQSQDIERIVKYALECAAALVSPPQLAGENAAFSCKDVANEIRLLRSEVTVGIRKAISVRVPKPGKK